MLTDAKCQPLVFMLTGGEITDWTAGVDLIEHLSECNILNGDNCYDATAVRRKVEQRGGNAEHPTEDQQSLEKLPLALLYRKRNAITRMFRHPKPSAEMRAMNGSLEDRNHQAI